MKKTASELLRNWCQFNRFNQGKKDELKSITGGDSSEMPAKGTLCFWKVVVYLHNNNYVSRESASLSRDQREAISLLVQGENLNVVLNIFEAQDKKALCTKLKLKKSKEFSDYQRSLLAAAKRKLRVRKEKQAIAVIVSTHIDAILSLFRPLNGDLPGILALVKGPKLKELLRLLSSH